MAESQDQPLAVCVIMDGLMVGVQQPLSHLPGGLDVASYSVSPAGRISITETVKGTLFTLRPRRRVVSRVCLSAVGVGSQ